MKNLFLNAITTHAPVKVYRIHAEASPGKIGLTAWYTAETIEEIKADIVKAGHKIIRIEEETNNNEL